MTIHSPSWEIEICFPGPSTGGVGSDRGVAGEKRGVVLNPVVEEEDGLR